MHPGELSLLEVCVSAAALHAKVHTLAMQPLDSYDAPWLQRRLAYKGKLWKTRRENRWQTWSSIEVTVAPLAGGY